MTVTPPDARAGANFGNALALRGNWLLVGAQFDAALPAFALGKAYVFLIDQEMDSVQWISTLNPFTPSNFDQWGSKLALGTDFAYVGSENAKRSADDAGQVEVFARMGMGLAAMWEYQETLVGADMLDHSFGSSIATTPDGRRVIVGADGGGAGGAFYLFDYNPQTGYFHFTLQYSLPLEHAEIGDNFGTSLSLSYDGSTAVVGADAEDAGKGKAWVFRLPPAMYSNFARAAAPPVLPTPLALVDPEGEVGEQFGSSVAIMGDLISVGAEENNDMGVNSGAVFLFGRDVGGPGNWGLIEQVNAPDASLSDRYGTSLALQEDHIAVGAPLWRDPDLAFSQGSAYVAKLPEPDATLLGVSALVTLLWHRRRARGACSTTLSTIRRLCGSLASWRWRLGWH
jgi:hypothetical protein